MSEVLHQRHAVTARSASSVPTIGAREQIGNVVGVGEIPAPESNPKRLVGRQSRLQTLSASSTGRRQLKFIPDYKKLLL
jgi:hypothetical protein